MLSIQTNKGFPRPSHMGTLRVDVLESTKPFEDCNDMCSDKNCAVSHPLCHLQGSKALTLTSSMNRTKSHFSLSSDYSSATSISTESAMTSAMIESHDSPPQFGFDVRHYTQGSPEAPDFDSGLRKVIEPYLQKARLHRENARSPTAVDVHSSIASSVGVPYTSLRRERPFLYDEYTYPLQRVFAETLQVEDLSMIHLNDPDMVLMPLLVPERRRHFQSTYDSFVTSFCIPLIHCMAMAQKLFHVASPTASITYRYQAFPTIAILRPGERSVGPTCDSAIGHSIGCLNFYVPLTPTYGTNSLFVESHPGREDWHPLTAKSAGLGYIFDGARCLHFELENTTPLSRVALNFRVLIYREHEGRVLDDGVLCPPNLIDDQFSSAGPGFYDEAVVDLSRSTQFGLEIVSKKHKGRLFEPDERNGHPFA